MPPIALLYICWATASSRGTAPDQPFFSRGTNRLLLLVEQLAEQFLSWWENNFWVFLRVSFSVSFTINTPVTGHLSRYDVY